MLIFSSIYSLTRLYYSKLNGGKNFVWNLAKLSLTSNTSLLAIRGINISNTHLQFMFGVVLLAALAIVTPIAFLFPPVLGLVSLPIVMVICLMAFAANLLHLVYRLVISPLIEGFFNIPAVQEAITTPIRFLRGRKLVNQGWDDFINHPEAWMASLCHYAILCSLIMLPEYYGLRYLVMPNFLPMDWFWHIFMVDTAIGIAMQFSPSSNLQQHLNHNEDHAVILGALNGMLLGMSQGFIGYYWLGTALDLGASGIIIGSMLNMGCAHVIQITIEWGYTHLISRTTSSGIALGAGGN